MLHNWPKLLYKRNRRILFNLKSFTYAFLVRTYLSTFYAYFRFINCSTHAPDGHKKDKSVYCGKYQLICCDFDSLFTPFFCDKWLSSKMVWESCGDVIQCIAVIRASYQSIQFVKWFMFSGQTKRNCDADKLTRQVENLLFPTKQHTTFVSNINYTKVRFSCLSITVNKIKTCIKTLNF